MAITKVHADMVEGIEEALEPHLEGYVHKTGGTLTGDLHLQSGLIINGATKEKVHEVTVENVPPEPIVSNDYWNLQKVKSLHDNGEYTIRQFPKEIVDFFSYPSDEIIEESTTMSLTSDGTHGIMVDYGPKFGYRGRYAVWKCDSPYKWDENSEVVCAGEFGGSSEGSNSGPPDTTGANDQPPWASGEYSLGEYNQWRRSAGLQFSPDGLKLFHTGADELSLTLGWHQLTKPYDISSSLNLNGFDFPALNDTIDCTRYLTAESHNPCYPRVVGLYFRPDGLGFYLLWYNYNEIYEKFWKGELSEGSWRDRWSLKVTQQNLNTPWDISESSLGYHYTFGGDGYDPLDTDDDLYFYTYVEMWPVCGSITWSPDGRYMYISNGIPYRGPDLGKDLFLNDWPRTIMYDAANWEGEYHPWEISYDINDFYSDRLWEEAPNGMAWNKDGSTFYSMFRRGSYVLDGYIDNPSAFEIHVYDVVPPPPPMEIDLNPQDGTMKTYTIEDEGEIAFVDNLENGQTLTLMLDCADPQKTPATVNWPDAIWPNTKEPPSLETGSLVVSLWKTKNILYGAVIGNYNDSDLSQQS